MPLVHTASSRYRTPRTDKTICSIFLAEWEKDFPFLSPPFERVGGWVKEEKRKKDSPTKEPYWKKKVDEKEKRKREGGVGFETEAVQEKVGKPK